MSGVGKRIGSGHLRVDAAKAVAKLRDYQLPDPLQWALECFRGAVGLGAEHIVAWGDSDDVWLAWRGPAPDPEELARLLDVLVSPQTRADRRWARLFAIGVNTALGLAPRFVDLWSLPAEGSAMRVRFSPALLADEGAGLRALAPEEASPPAELVQRVGHDGALVGGAVQMRRAFGLDVMGRYFSGREAAELERLRRATRESRVKVVIAGAAPSAPTDLVRLPLGPNLDGFLAVPSESGSQPGIALDVAERGAVLQELVMHLPGLEAPRGRLPLRIYVDAERLPTNAARSAVRLDERPLNELADRVGALLPKLIAELVTRLDEPPIRAAAIRLLAAACAGSRWAVEGRTVPALFQPLVAAPLLRDALGRPRALGSFPYDDVVHFGREPFDAALEPWLGDVLWCEPGDPALALLGEERVRSAEQRAKEARRHHAVREAWLKHPAREAVVDPAPGQLVALRFGESDGAPRGSRFSSTLSAKGLRGEVVLLDPSTLGAKRAAVGQLQVLLEGRPIATAQMEAPWPWVGVVEASFVPMPDYRGIVTDAVYERAVAAVRAAVLEAVELVAHAMTRPKDSWPKQAARRESLDALLVSDPSAPFAPSILARLREAQRAYAELAGVTGGSEIVALFKTSALARVPAWPVDDGKAELTWTPLRKLFEHVPKDGEPRALRLHVPESAPRAQKLPRVAVRVSAHDGPILTRLFPTVDWVAYDPTRSTPITARRLADRFAMSSELPCLVERESEGRRGVVALTEREPELVIYHRGQRLRQTGFTPSLLPCRIAIDDDFVVPNALGTALVAESPHALRLDAWERELLDALVDALGGAPSSLLDGRRVESLDWVREAVLGAVAKIGRSALDEARCAKLDAYPWIPRANATPVSLDDLRAEKGALSWVPRDARVDRDLDWHPVIASEEGARRIAQLVGRRASDGRAELERRRRDVDRARREEIIRSGAVLAMPEPGEEQVALTGSGMHGVVGLGRRQLGPVVRFDVRIEGHAYRIVDLASNVPLEAIVDLPMDALGPDRAGLLAETQQQLVTAAKRALGSLLVAVGTKAPERLVDDATVAAALEAWVGSGVRKGSKTATRLRALPAFRTVQGERASIDDAATHSRVRVATYVGAWLGPLDEDDGHTLDKPVLALPESGALRSLIEALAAPKGLLDHTRAVRTLQAERRVRQGVVAAPTLAEIPKALKSSIRELAARKRIPTPLGPGELGLVERGPSQAGVFANGSLVGWLPLGISPAVRAAMEIPALAEDATRMPATTGDRLAEPLRALTRRLLVEQVIPALDSHPFWVRVAVRRALGSGILEESDVRGAPIFETTADAWISLGLVRDQIAHFDDVWFTTRQQAAERRRRPLDDARFALRLEPDEIAGLAKALTLFDAAERLVQEDTARANLARPRVTELFFSTRVRPHLLDQGTYGRGARHGVVGLLSEPSELAGIHLFREGLPLGVTLTGFDWPIVALAESAALVPNATYDAAVDDAHVVAVRKAVAKEAEALLAARVGEPELAVVRSMRLSARHSSALGGPGAIRGVVGLRRDLDAGRVQIDLGARTDSFEPDVQPSQGGPRRALPIDGHVVAALPMFGTPLARVNAALRGIYAELLRDLVASLREGAPADDLLLAHVVRGTALGVYVPTPLDAPVVIPCFSPKPLTLPQVRELFAAESAVPVRAPGKLPKSLVALLDDGSRTSVELEAALGRRAQRPTELVTEKAVDNEHRAHAEMEWDPSDLERPSRAEAKPPKPEPEAAPKRTKPAPTPEPIERAQTHPLDPLAEHLLAQLAALGLPERVQGVRIDDTQRVLVRYRAEERTLWLGGRHASLSALQVARASRSPDAERAMRVLVAHVVGVLDRASAAVTDATQLGALGTLMTS